MYSTLLCSIKLYFIMDLTILNANYLQYDRIPVLKASRQDSNKSLIRLMGAPRAKGLQLIMYDVKIPYGVKASGYGRTALSIDIAFPSHFDTPSTDQRHSTIDALKRLDQGFKTYIQSQLPEGCQLNYKSLFHHDIITARVNKNRYGKTNLDVRDTKGHATGLYKSNSTEFVNATITLHYLWWSRDLQQTNEFVGGVFVTLDTLHLLPKKICDHHLSELQLNPSSLLL